MTAVQNGAPTLVERIALVLACAFVAELILGGPGYWLIGTVSIRKLLFTLNMLWFTGMFAAGRIRLRMSEVLIAVVLFAIMVMWIRLIPSFGMREQLRYAVQDGLPIATALLGLLYNAFFRVNPGMWPRLGRTAAICLVFVAIANVVLWCIGMSGDEGNIVAQAIGLYWFTLGRLDLEPPLYIGMMADGFFRAMWITAVLYVPALLYCIARRRLLGVLLFSLALLGTYTRALWLAALLGIVIAQALSMRQQPFLDAKVVIAAAFLALVASAGLLLSTVSGAGDDSLANVLGSRIGSTFSDNSASERFEQVGPLIEGWLQSPLIGKGFGASASLLRSDDTPFSYELTALALLMKVGVVGAIVIGGLIALLWAHAMVAATPRSRESCAGLAAILAFLAAAATNPFLLNFVGIAVLSYMLIRLEIDRKQTVAPTVA